MLPQVTCMLTSMTLLPVLCVPAAHAPAPMIAQKSPRVVREGLHSVDLSSLVHLASLSHGEAAHLHDCFVQTLLFSLFAPDTRALRFDHLFD